MSPSFYSCGLSTATIEYSSACACLCVCLSVCVSVSTITQNIIDLILGDLLQSVFSVESALDHIVQSKLVSLTKTTGF